MESDPFLTNQQQLVLQPFSNPGTSIRLLNRQGPLAAHPIRLARTPPPDLVAIDGRLLRVLARVEQIVSVVRQDAIAVKGPARRAHAGRGPADRLRLVRDDVRLLEASRGRVDGQEAEPVGAAGYAGAGHDERLRVGLVLDLADVGGAVGVEEAQRLQVVEVEAPAADGEAEVAGGGLALLHDGGGGGCGGGDEGQGGGGEG
jgi:hypothetical protein